MAGFISGIPMTRDAGVSSETPEADPTEKQISGLWEGRYATAAAAFQKAVNHDDVDTTRYLGDMTFARKGIAQDNEQAIRSYCKAALVGNLDAVARLEAIDISGYSQARAKQGWEAACGRWLKRDPPQLVKAETTVQEPEVDGEILVEQQAVREAY